MTKKKSNKDYISKNKNKKIIILIVLIILFWWFYIRPNQIRSLCSKIALNQAVAVYKKRIETVLPASKFFEELDRGSFLPSDYEFWYKMCLRNHGLRK